VSVTALALRGAATGGGGGASAVRAGRRAAPAAGSGVGSGGGSALGAGAAGADVAGVEEEVDVSGGVPPEPRVRNHRPAPISRSTTRPAVNRGARLRASEGVSSKTLTRRW
jgi:hypothetical protein